MNAARRENPALQRNERLRFHDVDNEQLLAYSKTRRDRRQRRPLRRQPRPAPHAVRAGSTCRSRELGIDADRPFQVHDLLGGGALRVARARATTSSSTRTSCRRTSSACAASVRTEHDFDYYAVTPPDPRAPSARRARPSTPAARQPDWYKDAIIYELHVRAFHDSNGDGIGDFRGLIAAARLPRTTSASPRSGCCRSIRRRCATTATTSPTTATSTRPTARCATSARSCARRTRRGLRVITELVLNHTSDQHPWFQRARRAPPGSPRARLLRVERHARPVHATRASSSRTSRRRTGRGTRSPAPTTGTASTRTSPTSTSTTPRSSEALFRRRRLLARDGRRRAAPRRRALPLRARGHELREPARDARRPAASCARTSTSKFADRMLLAEANQWPEDAVAYFGDGDECHMAFHFPLMPRMFMAIRHGGPLPDHRHPRRRRRRSPTSCQWAIFLRNHDELTLEMVTDEERDYMYRVYADDPQARINLGIRRRLAPLLGNDRRRIELMNGLLLSLPGTPVIYYGDEIGMGDNIYLGDRNGVRTPMQWSADRNAGFSRANPQKLYLPVDHRSRVPLRGGQRRGAAGEPALAALVDEAADRAAQALRRVRPRHDRVPAAREPQGAGLPARATATSASWSSRTCRASRSTSSSTCPRSRGMTPVEMFGGVRVPADRRAAVPAHARPARLLLVLARAAGRAGRGGARRCRRSSVTGHWPQIVESARGTRGARDAPARVAAGAALVRRQGAAHALGGDRGRRSAFPIRRDGRGAAGRLPRPRRVPSSREGDSETYLRAAHGVGARRASTEHTLAAARRSPCCTAPTASSCCSTALHEPRFARALLDLIAAGASACRARRVRSSRGRGPRHARRLRGEAARAAAAAGRAEQHARSSSATALILKLFRRVEEGENPDVEIGRFLTERTALRARLAAARRARVPRRRAASRRRSRMLQGYVPNEGDAWRFTLDAIGRFFEDALAPRRADAAAARRARSSSWPRTEPPDARARHDRRATSSRRALLGQRTAELHVALAAASDDPAFAPEPFTLLARAGALPVDAHPRAPGVRGRCAGDGDELAGARGAARARGRGPRPLPPLLDPTLVDVRIRVHGDYHLGQVLWTGKRLRHHRLRGRAGAAAQRAADQALAAARRRRDAALVPLRRLRRPLRRDRRPSGRRTSIGGGRRDGTGRDRAGAGRRALGALLVRVVGGVLPARLPRDARARPAFLPGTDHDVDVLLDVHLLEKAVYELRYEPNNRPDWVQIPARGHPAAARGIAPDGAGPGARSRSPSWPGSTALQTDYWDAGGRTHRPSDAALLAVLGALGAEVDDAGRPRGRGARAAREIWSRLAEPVVAVVVGSPPSSRCACPPGRPAARARRSRSRAAADRCASSSSARCRSQRPRRSTARSDASCA